MSKKINNKTAGPKTYAGQIIQAASGYNIPANELASFQSADNLFLDLGNGDVTLTDNIDSLEYLGANAVKFLLDLNSIQKTQNILAQDGLQSRPYGFSFTATAGQSTVYQYKLTEALQYRGGFVETENHVKIKDSFSCKFVDVDGVYYPPNTVVYDFVKNWPARGDGRNELDEDSITNIVPADLYIELEYNSVGAIDVEVGALLYGYK